MLDSPNFRTQVCAYFVMEETITGSLIYPNNALLWL